MALRNLSGGKRQEGSLDALDQIQPRADADAVSNREATAEIETPAPDQHTDPNSVGPQATDPILTVEIQLPGSSLDQNGSAANTPDKSSSPDPFLASLEALRRTLRQSKPDRPASSPDPVSKADHEPIATPSASDTDDAAVGLPPLPELPVDTESDDAESGDRISALESMPLPLPERAPTPVPQAGDPSFVADRKRTPAPQHDALVNGNSLDDALDAVRSSIGLPKAENGVGRQPSTPRPRRRRPLSDGIPKSVSEDLPKFRGKPRMRICNRCGHETKLRNPECQQCGKVDESLGILDAVISGDLAKVEQILLVRPHLISVQTSRHAWTLLHMAASGGNRKMVELLITKGAAVNAPNRDGKTALHYAAGKGHLHVVEALLAHHADPEIRYKDKSAAELAREHGQIEVETFLRNLKPPAKP